MTSNMTPEEMENEIAALRVDVTYWHERAMMNEGAKARLLQSQTENAELQDIIADMKQQLERAARSTTAAARKGFFEEIAARTAQEEQREFQQAIDAEEDNIAYWREKAAAFKGNYSADAWKKICAKESTQIYKADYWKGQVREMERKRRD